MTLYEWTIDGNPVPVVHVKPAKNPVPPQRRDSDCAGFHMIPGRKMAWCEGLRSGRWEQLRRAYVAPFGRRCAVGVLYAVVNLAFHGVEEPLITDERQMRDVGTWLGLALLEAQTVVGKVIDWNDNEELSFAEIADLIERTW